MKALPRKLLRDLAALKTQALAIGLVIACGVATFVMSISVLRSLDDTLVRYYEQFEFAQIFGHLKRAPQSLATRIADVPGVAVVQTRIVAEVTLDLPDLIEPAVGRLVSLPDYGEPVLNRIHLRSGRWPEPGRRGEILANEAFAAAHGFTPGDTLRAVLNGRREVLTIVGIALCPEYVYQIRGGDLFPDDRRFGVLWMRERPLAATFDLTKSFNDVALTLTRDAVESVVIERLDTLIAPYGGQGAYGRSEQVSHRYVTDELSQLRAMAYVPPVIFLLVAAFVLNVVLSRIVATQREQIATLKAFGYTPWEIGWHYLQLTLLIVTLGLVLGLAAGAWLGRDLAVLYARFFRFPALSYRLDPSVVVLAAGISYTAGIAGVASAIRRVARLAPAEAMRPEAPGVYRRAWFDRAGFRRRLGQTTRMAIRQIQRQPIRASLSVLGISLGIAVMVLGSFGKDLLDYIIDFQFGGMQHYRYSLAYVEPSSRAALRAAAQLPGAIRAEPFRAVPVRLMHGARSRRTEITGLESERDLLRLLDADGRPVILPSDGLLLSEKLAELLDVTPGDRLSVEVLEGSRPVRDVIVADTLRDFSGLSAYMELSALNRFLREGPVISGAFLATDPAQEEELHRQLKATPRIASVSSQVAALRSFQETISENLLRMRFFNVVFASIIAFGVVYNAARITLSERSRELATLRVIGLTRGEVSAALLGEIALLTALAIPIGLGLGRLLAMIAVWAMETETQRFPFIIQPATYATAVITIVIATALSSLVVRRRLDQLDLVGVLKSRD